MAYDVDFFVIGAGSGGVRAARIAARHGAKTVVAESFRVGGTCVIRGCVPKKLLVYASRFADDFREAEGFGWSVGETRFEWSKLVAAKEREITRLSQAYRDNLAAAGASLIEERAEILGPHRVRLAGGAEYSARHILIATGGRPTLPGRIEGIDLTITSNEVFDLTAFPRRLMVVGGGYIAVEFASLFRRLGADVVQVLRGDNVLRGFDEDMRAGMRDAMRRVGVDFRFGRLPTRIQKLPDGVLSVDLSDGATVLCDQVLVATGRAPNVEGLGLASASVALDERGAIKVDADSTTTTPSIHAVGDVSNRVNLTPVAIREGHALADRLFGAGAAAIDYDRVASAVFGTPELGSIGLTEAAATAKLRKVDVYKAEFRSMKSAFAGGEERTIMKLVVDGETQRVVGAHLLAHDAGEMIQVLAIAITMGATKVDIDATMAVHPTAAEELVTMRAPSVRYEEGERLD